MTNLVKTSPKRRLIVAAGEIVDPRMALIAYVKETGDPLWLQWRNEGSPTADYVPFQSVQPHECVCAEYREDWIGA
ncbi:MAG: hypothetical protein KDK05_32300 [Candidatus Competibacteraceae bacterium]|nr:hypothetical protein [Candidatus Competibacteraceae bacterium]